MFIINNQIINEDHIVRATRFDDGSLELLLTSGHYGSFPNVNDAQAVWEYLTQNTPNLNELVKLNQSQKERREQFVGKSFNEEIKMVYRECDERDAERRAGAKYVCQLCGRPSSATEHRDCIVRGKFASEAAG